MLFRRLLKQKTKNKKKSVVVSNNIWNEKQILIYDVFLLSHDLNTHTYTKEKDINTHSKWLNSRLSILIIICLCLSACFIALAWLRYELYIYKFFAAQRERERERLLVFWFVLFRLFFIFFSLNSHIIHHSQQ